MTDALRRALRRVEVEVVTGELDADERGRRVGLLAERAGEGDKVLVATDCLSEGVNLQDGFQAVVHYDLAWNPTRHEQREGRVDRFGQTSDVVRAVLLYGEDNGIDGIILDVLLRKHEAIRRDLGISVAVPPQTDQVLAALLEGILLRGRDSEQLTLDIGLQPHADALDEEWRSTAEAERRSRSRFAQSAIHPEEVQEAVDAARLALGMPDDVARFVRTALSDLRADILDDDGLSFTADISQAPVGLRNALGAKDNRLEFVSDFPAPRHAHVLQRTNHVVSNLARFVLDGALDSALAEDVRPARRAGLIATDAVTRLTVALLLRVRTEVVLPGRDQERSHIAEEARVVAFQGTPADPSWLSSEDVEALMEAKPTENVSPDASRSMIGHIVDALPTLQPALDEVGMRVAEELRTSHATVRQAARGDRAGSLTIRGLTVTPQLPVDVLGVYVFRPAGGVS